MIARLAAGLLMAVTVTAATPGAGAETADWTLERVMSALGAAEKPTVRFVEERHIRFMKDPIVVEGTLSYRNGVLEKVARTPKAERMVIDGDRLTVSTPGGEPGHTVYLADFPTLDAFITSLRATLDGNVAVLRRRFWLRFSASGAAWSLVLEPLDKSARAEISDVTIAGDAGRITSLTLHEASGDKTIVKILED